MLCWKSFTKDCLAITSLQSRLWPSFWTPLMLCMLISIHKGLELQFNIDSKQQICEKLFMAIVFTLRVLPEIRWEEIAEEIFFLLYFVLMLDLGFEPWAYRLVSQHTTIIIFILRIFVRTLLKRKVKILISFCFKCLSWALNHSLALKQANPLRARLRRYN